MLGKWEGRRKRFRDIEIVAYETGRREGCDRNSKLLRREHFGAESI
jgi:hypothetical protein